MRNIFVVSVRLLGLVALLFTPLWWLTAAVLLLLVLSGSKSPVTDLYRCSLEAFAMGCALWGIYTFPHIADTAREPAALVLAVLAAVYYVLAIIGCLGLKKNI